MTKEEYLRQIAELDAEYDRKLEEIGELADKENELKEAYIKEHKPYSEGTTVMLNLQREDGTPRRPIVGKITDWSVGKNGELRPYILNHPYSWHDVIISIEKLSR